MGKRDDTEYLVWSRLRGRLLDTLTSSGEYERDVIEAERAAKAIMEAPELVVGLGKWPEEPTS